MIGFVDRDGTGRHENAKAVRAEMDFGEIAEAMGISKQRVQQLYTKALRKLAKLDWSHVRAELDAREYAVSSRAARQAQRRTVNCAG